MVEALINAGVNYITINLPSSVGMCTEAKTMHIKLEKIANILNDFLDFTDTTTTRPVIEGCMCSSVCTCYWHVSTWSFIRMLMCVFHDDKFFPVYYLNPLLSTEIFFEPKILEIHYGLEIPVCLWLRKWSLPLCCALLVIFCLLFVSIVSESSWIGFILQCIFSCPFIIHKSLLAASYSCWFVYKTGRIPEYPTLRVGNQS